MSENAVVSQDIDVMTWGVMKEQAIMLVKSGFLPKAVDTPEKAMAIAMKGRELGIPMMQSITSINVIDGKPALSAELMAALVFQRIQGAVLRCVETSNTICTYEAGRPNEKILRMSFTWEDAVKAGITGKMNWQKYPAAMLRARCCSAICRIVFPDAIMGCYTPDELGAITTEEGIIEEETINITPTPITPPQAKKPSTTAIKDVENVGYITIEAVIEKTSSKKGKKGGKEWILYGILADGIWYNTFSKTFFDVANASVGKKVTITYQATEKGNNLVAIQKSGCTGSSQTCDLSSYIDGKAFCEDGATVCMFQAGEDV